MFNFLKQESEMDIFSPLFNRVKPHWDQILCVRSTWAENLQEHNK